MNENKEVCELADITVSRVIEQLGDPKLLASKLVSTLGELTKQDSAEEDIGFEGAKYHATRLALELGNAKHDADKDRRYINRIWKDLLEAFEVIQPSIENDARKAEYRKILKPRKTDPKTGRVEFYFEEVELCQSKPESIQQTTIYNDRLLIDYMLVKRPKLSLMGRAFSKVNPTFMLLFFKLLPLIILVALVIWPFYLVIEHGQLITVNFVIALIYAALFWGYFGSYIKLRRRGAVIAPDWASTITAGKNLLLEVRDEGEKPWAGNNKAYAILCDYESSCPICGAEVEVRNGEGPFRKRLVGCCVNNPVEHIFSFDHVTRKGVSLRSDTYLG